MYEDVIEGGKQLARKFREAEKRTNAVIIRGNYRKIMDKAEIYHIRRSRRNK